MSERSIPVSEQGLADQHTWEVFNDFVAGLREDKILYKVLRGPSTDLRRHPQALSAKQGLMIRTFLKFPGTGQATLVVFPLNGATVDQASELVALTRLWLQDHSLENFTMTQNPLMREQGR